MTKSSSDKEIFIEFPFGCESQTAKRSDADEFRREQQKASRLSALCVKQKPLS
jgi:hypothetical protein